MTRQVQATRRPGATVHDPGAPSVASRFRALGTAAAAPVCAAVALLALSACGQKGPLRPPPAASAAVPATAVPAPVAPAASNPRP